MIIDNKWYSGLSKSEIKAKLAIFDDIVADGNSWNEQDYKDKREFALGYELG